MTEPRHLVIYSANTITVASSLEPNTTRMAAHLTKGRLRRALQEIRPRSKGPLEIVVTMDPQAVAAGVKVTSPDRNFFVRQVVTDLEKEQATVVKVQLTEGFRPALWDLKSGLRVRVTF